MNGSDNHSLLSASFLCSFIHPPSPTQAWVLYQTIQADVANGTVTKREIHPALHSTLVAVSGMGLNNQFDAKRFESLYEDKVKEWFKKTYWVGAKQ